MASVNWVTQVISVPQSDLTLISGTLYEHDTNEFRKQLNALSDDEEGMPYPRTHDHQTTYTVAGVTYARKVEIINGYSVEYEDGDYSVRLAGSNNNIWDKENGILVKNNVLVIPTNSAGLIETGVSGLTPTESAQLSTVHGELRDIEGSFHHSHFMRGIMAATCNKSSGANWGQSGTMNFRDVADTKDRLSVQYDAQGNRLVVTVDLN